MSHPALQYFAMHRTALLRYARSLGVSADDAEDCAQMALIRAFKNIHLFRGNDYNVELKSWLVVILRNSVYDTVRRRSVRVRKEGEAAFSAPMHCDCAGIHACQLQDLETGLCTLNQNMRDVFCQQALGAEYDEIAQTQGVPVGTVKSRLSRARMYLEDAQA